MHEEAARERAKIVAYILMWADSGLADEVQAQTLRRAATCIADGLHDNTVDPLRAAVLNLLSAIYIGEGQILCPPALAPHIKAMVQALGE